MDRPDIALKDYLKSENVWTLTTDGLNRSDIIFTTSDVTNSAAYKKGKPLVIVKTVGWQRLQDAESSLHSFTLLVQVCIHPVNVDETAIENAKTKQWQIGEFIKFAVEEIDKQKIEGWESAIAKLGAFTDIVEALPEDLILNITVEANIQWHLTVNGDEPEGS